MPLLAHARAASLQLSPALRRIARGSPYVAIPLVAKRKMKRSASGSRLRACRLIGPGDPLSVHPRANHTPGIALSSVCPDEVATQLRALFPFPLPSRSRAALESELLSPAPPRIFVTCLRLPLPPKNRSASATPRLLDDRSIRPSRKVERTASSAAAALQQKACRWTYPVRIMVRPTDALLAGKS